MYRTTFTVLIALLSALRSAPVVAEDVSTSEIIKKLNRPATRTVRQMTTEELDFLRRIPARGISIEAQEAYVKVVQVNKLPSIDIPVRFEFDSAKLTDAAYAQVEKLARALKTPELAKHRFSLNGFTDSKGGEEHNKALSEARAASVQEALVTKFGISSDRLVAIGFGEQMLKDERDPEGAINRRVEVIRLGEL